LNGYPATAGAIPLLWRLFAKLRRAFPKAKLRVRLDGGYAAPEIFDGASGFRVGSHRESHAFPGIVKALCASSASLRPFG
jgi:hypothetical protein